MNILYGVAGEGFGHSSRAKAIISHLESKGHKVLVLAYGMAYKALKNHFNILKIEGIRFKFKKQQLSLQGTIEKSIPFIIKNIKTGKARDRKILSFAPDLAITDFEPVTAILAYKYKLPLISIDNQHRLSFLKIKIPEKYLKDYLLAKHAVSIYIPKADFFIVLSFTKEKSTENRFFVSPILRKEIIKAKPKTKNYILVYMNQPYKSLIKILSKINEKFIVYGYNKEKKENNLTFKNDPKLFIKDLVNCKAIISTAGFTLMSESLYLKKPLFALPLQGQFEQTLNALFLQQACYGTYSDNPSRKEIQKFIKNLNYYKNNLKNYNSNPNQVFSILDKIIKNLDKKR